MERKEVTQPCFVWSHAITGFCDTDCGYRIITWKGHALKSISNVVLIEFRYIRCWDRRVVKQFPISTLHEEGLSGASKFHAECHISSVHSKLHGSAWISFLRKFVQLDMEWTTRKVSIGISYSYYINGASWGALQDFQSGVRITSWEIQGFPRWDSVDKPVTTLLLPIRTFHSLPFDDSIMSLAEMTLIASHLSVPKSFGSHFEVISADGYIELLLFSTR